MLTKEQKEGIRDLAQQDHGAGEPMWSGASGLARWARAAGEAGDSITGDFLRDVLTNRVTKLHAEAVYRGARVAALTPSERSALYEYGVEWHAAAPWGDTYSVTCKEEA